MRLGMPTLIEFRDIHENIRLCKELDLAFIELNMNLPICLPETMPANEIMRLKRLHGIDFTIHLPEELDLSSFHPAIRRGHIQRCKETLEWAHAAEIQTLNMHLNNGIYFTIPQQRVWINEQYEAKYLELLLDSCAELYDLAKQLSVNLCIENACNFHYPFMSSALDKLSGMFDRFYLTWDVGHDAKVEYKEQPFILSHAEQVRHIHLHDYNGQSDHQPLCTGIVPIEERLKFAEEHDLSVVVEVKTSRALKESIHKLKSISEIKLLKADKEQDS
ncbi:sugar phosphate isomerase/epimerase [Paenibacillus sp. NFR01]|uniref:sugar phosphate isomerase/epimerase family protein n=1 Tax=Paenibacillus sp. NFR01 TaxID=1566279 RepID=UPI0008C576F6|nr:TIM barrel protein [Paenibacillus sp. NFR01]SES88713.1 Sugar phosphate isomerase/epimerase [Paenibacillus sp. NFR01]